MELRSRCYMRKGLALMRRHKSQRVLRERKRERE
jgi:hypothetical protein